MRRRGFPQKTGRLYASAKGGKCYNIISIRPQGQMALLQLEGVNDMDAARALRGRCSTSTAATPPCPRAGGMWPTSSAARCGTPTPERCTASSPAWTTRRTGHLYGQVPSGKEYMFPGVDAFLKERNPPEGYILVTPSRACWTTISTVSGRRSERWECVWTL